ncbi:glycosyltransferase [Tamlana sp. 2201CG12-4]|uniref:glycosyltransferase family 2 protein n=1 Tax=Tamlana sp. 2201CG12-4 TaxID=3112582 RepID=UPI002DC03528|nr:glycosyltransferase [Tamlana sp. 2201CG12-4]MEC3906698.1 glycosyltransferase [Tamlana sp. 2201CG12-4]
MIIFSLIIIIIYIIFIGRFTHGFDKVKVFELSNIPAKTKFSVVIPFRNEAEHLPGLLKSIEALKYPKHLFEVILVDDASDDSSAEIVKTFIKMSKTSFNLISNKRLTGSPKKDAITTAISTSKNDWIVTTDADCILPKYWLNSFDEFIQKTKASCVVAPVLYQEGNHLLHRFQILDMLSLQGATIGGFGIGKPFLCNGANFAYKKALFSKLKGFEGNSNISSGDDIFMLEKVVQTLPEALYYLKSDQAIVITKPQPTWKDLCTQRIRWAAKTSAYNHWFGKFTGLIVLLMNALLIIALVLSVMGLFKLKLLFYLFFMKFNIDVLLIYKSAAFFRQKSALRNYLSGFIIYPFFSVYVAFISVFSSYKWKGRRFSK